MLLKASNISKSYGTRLLFKDVSFDLARGQRLCVVGPNGSGKSTLLKIIAGLEDADSGKVHFAKNVRWVYVPQDTAQMETFQSGGQKIKTLLMNALASKPDILILDEPTNNLDIAGLEWLEKIILEKALSYIIVSHDRVFLDRTVNRILEIDPVNHVVHFSRGTYSEYLKRKELERERKVKLFKDQEEEVNKIEISIQKKRIKSEQGARWSPKDSDKFLRGFKRDRAAGSGRSAKVLENRLNKIEKLEKPKKLDKLGIKIDKSDTHGDHTIKMIDVVAGYKNSFALDAVSTDINFGSRVAITGANGSGKSTLLKTLCGYSTPLGGEVRVGNGVRIGNLMQEHDNMYPNVPVIEFLQKETGLEESEIFPLLAYYGLNAQNVRGRCGDLSPGQRARVIIAVMQATKANTLILDEPTNHLDLDAMDALYELLESFKGTVIAVSHDRYFLKQLKPDYVYEIMDGAVQKIISKI